MPEKKELVKQWYDGFCFGTHRDIYNPWSITNYLKEKKLRPYWAATSSNGLISKLLQSASVNMKEELEKLTPMPQTAQCPICGGTNLQVTLADAEFQKGTRVAQKCIHYLYGEDYIYPLSLRVYDACLSCTDAENPWHGEEYDIPIDSSTICHGYQ